MIDLHVHSLASDGVYSVPELYIEAKKKGLFALAITDHETVEGIIHYQDYFRRKSPPYFISGIEISVDYEMRREGIHVLGYFPRINSQSFLKALRHLAKLRQKRNYAIINKLTSLGLHVDMTKAQDIAQKTVIGRPHIAALLYNKGYVYSMEEAFHKYIGHRGQAFVPKEKLGIAEGVALLKKAGALVVIAHPWFITRNIKELEIIVNKFLVYGLDGIEVHYPGVSEEKRELLLELCRKYNLLPTGGSDFHGFSDYDVELGTADGTVHIEDELLFSMLEKKGMNLGGHLA